MEHEFSLVVTTDLHNLVVNYNLRLEQPALSWQMARLAESGERNLSSPPATISVDRC